MGRARQRPERLAEKLRYIRLCFGLSQSELIKRLGAEEMVAVSQISAFELGLREPSLPVLLRYARATEVPTEVLIDDELDLPDKLPQPPYHEGIKRKFSPPRKRR